MIDLEKLHSEVNEIIKPKGEPVGLKLHKEVPKRRYYNGRLALCQALKLASYGREITVDAEGIDACVIGSYVLGFKELPEDLSKRWVEWNSFSYEVFKKMIHGIHSLPMGEYKYVTFAPLKNFKLMNEEPEGVVIIVNSAQAYLLIAGYFDSTGNKPTSDFNGHAACEVVAAVKNGRSPWLTLPCGGARAIADAHVDELWVGMSVNDLEKSINRLKSVGRKYPAPLPQELISPLAKEHPLTKLISRTF